MPTIGVISDTHNFFDPRIRVLFKNVEHIFHGGDVGTRAILGQLQKLAPVAAVLGNTDDASLGCRETESAEVCGRKFLVHHIVSPHDLGEALQERVIRERPEVLIFGHTHKPFEERIDGTLFLNPGAAGKARFGLARTVALIHCDEKNLKVEFLPL